MMLKYSNVTEENNVICVCKVLCPQLSRSLYLSTRIASLHRGSVGYRFVITVSLGRMPLYNNFASMGIAAITFN